MAKARLMNRPEDYCKVGVKPGTVEMWEDGIRVSEEKGCWEWWYFDAVLDDGTKVVIQFFSRSGASIYKKGLYPTFSIQVTLPDGTAYRQDPVFSREEASWSKEQCDVRYGEHYFTGDLKDYAIHVEPIQGLGADLKLHSLTRPYRPGSSYFEFGQEGRNYTWLCVVPKGEVSGTLTVDGKTVPVHGFGYHDHQWGTVNFLQEWNHWVWARQNYEDYTILLFDMVSAEKTEFTRFPIVFVQDKGGNLVFESTDPDHVNCRVAGEYLDETSGKIYPKTILYTFEQDGKALDYTLAFDHVIECNGKNNLPPAKRMLTKVARLDPAYTRYYGRSRMVLTDGEERIERNGNLIYEFMYPGKTFKGHM